MLFKDKNKAPNKCLQLVVDIGKTTTDIHIYMGEVFRFSRTISIGGDDFDRILASSTGTSKEKALSDRLSNKYDPTIFEEIMSNFQRELARSIDYFRYRYDNQENTKFDKAFILGGNSNVNEIQKIVGEITNEKCVILDDAKYILVKGLSVWKQSSDINLLPVSDRPQTILKIKKMVLVGSLITFAVSAITGFALIKIDIARTNKEIKVAKNDINKLETFLATNKEPFEHLQMIKNITLSIEKVKLNSISHATTLEHLRKHIPRNIQLKNLSITNNQLSLNAKAPNLATLSLFLNSLNAWENYENFFISQTNFSDGSYIFSIQGNRKEVTNND
jgi:Tfp pilus assembly protein PilN